MKRVVVGMSGGVDSTVTALLLKEAGWEVIGATLRTSSATDIGDAREMAQMLGIRFEAPECFAEFDENVRKPFCRAYLQGRTPNPCVDCNRTVKWVQLLRIADAFGAEAVATGHYASVIRLPNGRYTVRQADHTEKDQTYMLYRLTQDQLARTLMPLGKYSKPEIRRIAEAAGLSVAQKRDSQEICFVTEGSYADLVEQETEKAIPGEGYFVSEDGTILGRHRGIIHYTVGQRRGLIAAGHPVYVLRINAGTNEVVLGEERSLYSSEIRCSELNFQSIPEPCPGDTVRAKVRVRYHHAGEWASILREADDSVRITFDAPVRAAAPGQSAVFYDEDGCVIGGGKIIGSIADL